MGRYLYLHGFASSPRSTKVHFLRDRFQEQGLTLHTPDLNQNDFSHLTLTRQLQQVQSELPIDAPLTVIGSSFGGLTAAWVGECHNQVERLVLLAPAFGFLEHWLPKLETEQLDRWRTEHYLSVYHYGEQRMMPLHYDFVSDLQNYRDAQIQRPVPTLILHGQADDVIPVQASRNFAAQRPWVELVEFNSDHALIDVLAEVWQLIQDFCQLSK